MNKTIIMGRMGKDPETRETENSTMCKFTVATNRKWKDNESTTWHNVVAWGKQAELIQQYFHKGSPILIEGRIDNRSYDKDGETKWISEIVLENFEFVGGRKEASNAKDASGAAPVTNYAENIPNF
jgi:single-strand DNA-binding protein